MNPPSEFQDIKVKCIDCGDDFIFTAGEQKYFRDNNLHQPKRCFNCRKNKREQLHGEKS